MTITYDEDRARAECRSCNWAGSGAMWRVEDKADLHEAQNSGHHVFVKAVQR